MRTAIHKTGFRKKLNKGCPYINFRCIGSRKCGCHSASGILPAGDLEIIPEASDTCREKNPLFYLA
jgi:hypothetical protein